MHGGTEVFELVPTLLNNILKTRAWETRTDQNGQPFKSFNDFVTHRRWEGLGSDIQELLLYCKRKEFKNVKEAIMREMPEWPTLADAGAKGGRGNKASNNITSFRGTSQAYAIRRLKRDRPDLAEKVIRRELSANAAAIEAGFRKPPSPLKALQNAWSRASEDDRAAFRAWVEEQ